MSSDFFNCCYSDKVTSQTNFEAILLYFRKLNIMIKAIVVMKRRMSLLSLLMLLFSGKFKTASIQLSLGENSFLP